MAMSPDFLCQSCPSLALQETVSLSASLLLFGVLSCVQGFASSFCHASRGLLFSGREVGFLSLSLATTLFPEAFAFSDVHFLPVSQHSEGVWHQQNTGRDCIRFNRALMVQVPLGFEKCYVGEEERFDFNER